MNPKNTCMRKPIVLLMLIALLASCAKQEGVVVRVTEPQANGPKMVRLLPISDAIIRVSATAEDAFAD